MKHIIISGASRGLGAALVEELAGPEARLYLIARRGCEETQARVVAAGGHAESFGIDLTDLHALPAAFGAVLGEIEGDPAASSVSLVNNAGTLHPLGPIGKYAYEDYRRNLEINFTAPALLTHLFISAVQEKELEKRVVFISSGAAQKAYRGWTHYCSTKAGLDMLMQAIALEQSDRERPVQVAAFNPGRIETDMQKLLREQSPEDFPAVDDFVAAATDGRTGSPREAARKLAGLLLSADYPHGRTVRASELTG